jgi:hypothetical protein
VSTIARSASELLSGLLNTETYETAADVLRTTEVRLDGNFAERLDASENHVPMTQTRQDPSLQSSQSVEGHRIAELAAQRCNVSYITAPDLA